MSTTDYSFLAIALAVTLIRQQEGGQQVAIIGSVATEHPGKAILRSGIGGRRVINTLVGEPSQIC